MATFTDWLAEMQSAGLIPTGKLDKPKQTAATMLGVSDDTITNLISGKTSFDLRYRLACRALLHRMEPY